MKQETRVEKLCICVYVNINLHKHIAKLQILKQIYVHAQLNKNVLNELLFTQLKPRYSISNTGRPACKIPLKPSNVYTAFYSLKYLKKDVINICNHAKLYFIETTVNKGIDAQNSEICKYRQVKLF